MTTRHVVLPLLVVGLLCRGADRVVHADGGQVRLTERHGDVEVTVFTSPNPLRAGPVDVSVCLQDAAAGGAVVDLPVVVEATARSGTSPTIRKQATTSEATNKLYKAAVFEIDAPGWWDVRIECVPSPPQEPFVVRFAMEAGPPLPAWLTVWPWYGWPVLVVLVYAIHRRLVYRRHDGRVRQEPDRRI